MIKNKLVVLFALFTIYGISAQQDAQYTQYMYNTVTVNPAYAGSRGALSVNALHRSQWMGLEGAPSTQTLNVHAPVGKGIGLGFSILNDKIGNGVNQDTYLDGMVSYSVATSSTGQLSFGIKLGGHDLNVNLNNLARYRPDLNFSGQETISNFKFNFGAGIYYHTDKFYLGLSAPNFIKTQHFSNSNLEQALLVEERVNFYFITGQVFNLNPSLKLKPAALVKSVSGAPLQLDVSSTVLFNDKFSAGVAYRLDAAFSGLFGFQVSHQLFLGMAYDREITELGNTSFNDGSFEIIFRYDFISRFKKVKSSRFF